MRLSGATRKVEWARFQGQACCWCQYQRSVKLHVTASMQRVSAHNLVKWVGCRGTHAHTMVLGVCLGGRSHRATCRCTGRSDVPRATTEQSKAAIVHRQSACAMIEGHN
jgi:hypothetical protein